MRPFIWTWEAVGVRITASRLHQERGGVSAECVIERRHGEIWKRFTSYRVSLTSISGRREFIRDMNALWEGPDWVEIAHQLCDQTLGAWRTSEPSQISSGETPLEAGTWILNPILYAGHTTVLYGPGDSGKSTVGVLAALLLAQGGCVAGIAAGGGFRPLYLDWERTFSTFDSRIGALIRGHPDLAPSGKKICYQRLTRPLAECLEDIEDTIAFREADVLIIDSLGMAAGGDLNAPEAATRLFEAIDTIGCPALVIGHTHKASEEKTIYGSVFFYNLASLVWEVNVDRDEEEGPLRLGLTNQKDNLSRRHAPLGLSIQFQDDLCIFSSFNPADSPVLSKKLSRAKRILHLLGDHLPRTLQEIASDLGDDPKLISTELNKAYNKGKYWNKIGEGWMSL